MKIRMMSLIVGLSISAAAQANPQQSFDVKTIIGYRNTTDATPIHIFKGFGYHADAMIGELDLTEVSEIPEKFQVRYVIGLDQFSGVKMNYEYIPTCNGTSEDSDFRMRARDFAQPLQTRIVRDEKRVKIRFSESIIEDVKVKVAEVYFPELKKTFQFATNHPILIANSNAQLNCDFDAGSGVSSVQKNYSAELQCHFSITHSHPSATPERYAISVQGSSGKIADLTTGVVATMKQNRVGYQLDQPINGHSMIFPYVPPTASHREKYFMINGGVYLCK